MSGNLTGFSNSLFDEFWRLQQGDDRGVLRRWSRSGALRGRGEGCPTDLRANAGTYAGAARLPVFAFVGSAGPVANTMDRRVAVGTAALPLS
jgi:hypothetical protein